LTLQEKFFLVRTLLDFICLDLFEEGKIITPTNFLGKYNMSGGVAHEFRQKMRRKCFK